MTNVECICKHPTPFPLMSATVAHNGLHVSLTSYTSDNLCNYET